jgi:hypothetical protein
MWAASDPQWSAVAVAGLVVAVLGAAVTVGTILSCLLRKLGFCLPPPTNEYEAFYQAVRRRLRWNFYTLVHCNRFRHEGVARFAWAIPNAAAVRAIATAALQAAERVAAPPETAGTGSVASPFFATTAIKRKRVARIVDFGAGSGYWASLLARREEEPGLGAVEVIAIEKCLNLYAKRPDGSIGMPSRIPSTSSQSGGGSAGAAAAAAAAAAVVPREDLWYDVQPGDLSTLTALQRERPFHLLLLVWPPCWEDMAYDAVQAFRGDCVVYVGESRGGATVSATCCGCGFCCVHVAYPSAGCVHAWRQPTDDGVSTPLHPRARSTSHS